MLQLLPDSFAATRDALHRVAEEIVAPARKPHNEIALRQTPGGFGTPPFDFDGKRTQVRLDGAQLVLAANGEETRAQLTTLAEAGELLGPRLPPDGVPDDTELLSIDPPAADRLGDFDRFSADILELFREELPPDAEPSEINLWPEHFDIAFEAGSEAAGQRANYGASPGDEQHLEPYWYVGPWSAKPEGPLWSAKGFPSAELTYAELLTAGDPKGVALELFRSRFQALAGRL
jgi:hypothetical protein